jgi:amidase
MQQIQGVDVNGAPDGFIFVQDMDLGGDGLRVGVKDSIDIEGFATRMGSPCFADAPPAPQHADVVRALLDAGCRIVGKTNMHELAYGVTGINRWTGTPVNPRAPGRVPGGSSSGSAVAVAADETLCALARMVACPSTGQRRSAI